MFTLRFPAGVLTALALLAGARFHPHLPVWGWILAGSLGLLLGFAPRLPRPGAAAFLAVILSAAAAGALRPGHGSPSPLPGGDHRLAGTLETWEATAKRTVLVLRVHRFDSLRVVPPAPVRVLAPAGWGTGPRSAWLAFRGKVLPERGVTNPGGWASDRFAAAVLVRGSKGPDWGPGTVPRIIRLRLGMVAFLRDRIPGFPGRLAEAVLLGRSHALTEEERVTLRRSGASHLVAVSGLHVGLVALLAGLILAPAPVSLRLSGVAVTAWVYAALAGWSPSAVRSATLVGAWTLGSLFHRGRPPVAWLALAGPWLLWADPHLANSVGFQLSLSAVGGILFVLDILGPGRSRLRRILAPAAASLGAQWGTLPVAVAAFGQVAPFALLPNLAAVPLVGLFLPALLFAFLFSPVPVISSVFLQSAEGLGRSVETVLRFSGDRLPFHTGIPPSSGWVRLAVPALVILWFSLPEDLRRRFRFRIPALALAGSLTGACFLPVTPPPGPWVAFLDVGQGDAAVLRLRDGTTWVVDVGDDRGGDAARFVLLPFLRHQGIRRVDGLVISHRHRDHVGGLARFLEGVKVGAVYDAGYGSAERGTPARVDSLLDIHRLWPCLVAAGDTLHRGRGGCLTVLGPDRGDAVPGKIENLNNASLVLRFEDGGFSIVFSGDAEAEEEAELLRRAENLRARILKVGHHGSRTSSGPGLLDAVAPEWAVISCGEENRFHHPSPEIVDRLRCRGIRVARTDRDGAVWIRPSERGFRVRVYPPRKRREFPDPGMLPVPEKL